MHSKLAGHLPLQDLIQSTLMSARTKLAAAEEDDKKKVNPFAKKKEEAGESKKEEKEEHEDGKEKKSSVIDPSDPSDIEKLASALDYVGEEFLKMADSIENGGESHQGGEQLPTNNPLSGKQSYKKDGSKKHQIPTATGMEARKETGPAATAVPDTLHSPPVPLKSSYPAKGVLKTAAEAVRDMVERKKSERSEGEKTSSVSRLQNALHKLAEFPPKKDEKKEGKKEEKKEEKDEKETEKKSAVNFILGKIAESSQGGMTLDSPSGVGPKPASDAAGGNDARKTLENIQSVIDFKKVDGKKPQKRMLAEVLSEPALTKSTDSKVQENLRNAAAGGVKIAAARAYLAKIAADESNPKHEELKKALAKKKEEKSEESSEEKKES